MFDLSGRKALVTGATGGIGEAIARLLHAQGATVGLHGTRVEKLEALASDLGDRVKLFPADLTKRDDVKALGQKAEAGLEGVDILVNNAGITSDGLFVRMSDADWDSVIEVNLTAVFRLTRELTHPMMRRRKGRIINITSVVGVTGNPGQANYCASKAGMIGFTKSLAQEIATRNVTVNCVAPGFIEFGHDRQAQRQAEGSDHERGPVEAHGNGRRGRCGGGLPCVRRGRLHHRPDHPREWRHGDDLKQIEPSRKRRFQSAFRLGRPEIFVYCPKRRATGAQSPTAIAALRTMPSFSLISGNPVANEGT